MSSSGINHVPDEHKDLMQYGQYAILSAKMLCYSYAASLATQHSILNEL